MSKRGTRAEGPSTIDDKIEDREKQISSLEAEIMMLDKLKEPDHKGAPAAAEEGVEDEECSAEDEESNLPGPVTIGVGTQGSTGAWELHTRGIGSKTMAAMG